ncbi:hypothetical protein ACWGTI_02700 [Mesorhizobium sp. ArgA1]
MRQEWACRGRHLVAAYRRRDADGDDEGGERGAKDDEGGED